MASAGGVFSETLQSITTTKLDELSKKRSSFEEEYSAIQASAQLESDPLTRLLLLVDGIKSCFSVKTAKVKSQGGNLGKQRGKVISGSTNNPRLETDLKIVDRFLEQARFDPSLSSKKLSEWEQTLWHHLEVQAVKYQYASLYGQLVTEWLSSEGEKTSAPPGGDSEMSGSFVEIPIMKKLEAREEWKRSVFVPHLTDQQTLKTYLNGLFENGDNGDDAISKAMESLREKVEHFETNLATPNQFNNQSLRWTIQGLLSSGLLIDAKNAVLRDFLTNDTILSEIADVLNMRMAALETWTWGGDVLVQENRKINGTYEIRLDEDLMQAIFLQFIGVRWAVFLKGALRQIRQQNRTWKSNQNDIPYLDKKRREYYLGPQSQLYSIQRKRKNMHSKNYFLFQLPDSVHQTFEVDEGEEEAEIAQVRATQSQLMAQMPQGTSKRTKQTARKSTGGKAPRKQLASKAARMASYKEEDDCDMEEDYYDVDEDDDEHHNGPRKPMEVKQSLLHLLSTEIALNTRFHGELTCFRSAFEDWNPLLPHQTILTVLDFFGVSIKWLGFFRRFLEAPLRFADEDGPTRTRKRGTPGAHALSDFFGEAVLFCLDFSVNKNTDGVPLYRMFDDFWFWSPDQRECVKAWATVQNFNQVMGVSLNTAKTGTVRICNDSDEELTIDLSLPEGQIRWGFLYLDAKTGRFEIDQSMIDSQIEELRHQLFDKQMSIFSWIHAWNTFATTFFTTNFGKPANCYGQEHVDKILSTHERIHRAIFSSNGSVINHLKNTLKERFGVENVPDGFLFFPIELGGLNLQNPFIDSLQVRDAVVAKPSDLLDEFEEAEKEEYRAAKLRFENGDLDRNRPDYPEWEPAEDRDVFMSFDEFVKYRENYDTSNSNQSQLLNIFDRLMQKPNQVAIDANAKVLTGLNSLNGQQNLKGILPTWYSMEPYWKWVAQLYGPEMLDRFGGFNIVDTGSLPMGMLNIFRGRKVQWQG